MLTFGGTKLVRKLYRVEDGVVDEESGAYKGGATVGFVHSVAIEGLAGARLYGWTSKIAIHPPHHTFGKLGKLWHLQVIFFKKGVKESDRIFRVPIVGVIAL